MREKYGIFRSPASVHLRSNIWSCGDATWQLPKQHNQLQQWLDLFPVRLLPYFWLISNTLNISTVKNMITQGVHCSTCKGTERSYWFGYMDDPEETEAFSEHLNAVETFTHRPEPPLWLPPSSGTQTWADQKHQSLGWNVPSNTKVKGTRTYQEDNKTCDIRSTTTNKMKWNIWQRKEQQAEQHRWPIRGWSLRETTEFL